MADRKKLKTPGKNGFKYRPKFGVIVLCDNEREQQTTYEKLKRQGHALRVVTV